MEWAVIAQLALKYGVPFVDQLLQNIKNNTIPTIEEWNNLKTKIEIPFDVLVPKA